MSEVAEPAPRSRDVLVKVVAASINIDDIHVAEGTFYGGIPIGPRPRPRRLVIRGCDLAGVVAGVGDRVRSIRFGDPVFGIQLPFRACGAWAELCVVNEGWLTRKPDEVSFRTAAASGVSGLVALSAIRALTLRPGMRIVIVGATGGIGGMAVQLAVRAGAEVIGVCGPANVERAYGLGCSLVLDYRREAWDAVLRSIWETRIDRVLDLVGGEIEAAGRRVLGPGGTFVTVVGPERFIGHRNRGRIVILMEPRG